MEEAFFGVNVQSTVALGEARGVALFVAGDQGVPVTGYPPATVKQTVVGHGRATKQQVGFLVRALLAMRRLPAPDAADALAIAICHARRQGGAAPRCARQGGTGDRVSARAGFWRATPESAVLDVAGVGYQVLVSAGTAGALPSVGAETSLYVHTHFVKDEPLRLYGFADAGERRLFQTLIDVQGVGPRVALAILAGLEPAELVRAIVDGGRSAAHAGEGRGPQNRRTTGARAARENSDRASREGRRPGWDAIGEPHPLRPARRRGKCARPARL